MADPDPAPTPDADPDAGVGLGADVVTVRDRFLAAGVSPDMFAAHLAAHRIAVDGERITDPSTPAPLPTTVGVMLDPE